MPRGPRLDAPGSLHHVRGRGIDRGVIFIDDRDRNEFLRRLGKLAEKRALRVLAWALMPNHFHLLVQTGSQPLERSMRALLSGYAVYFNRRHGRSGHLFQNRYKSTLCEDEAYLLTLVRYIHRNPLPTVVGDRHELAAYPYTGHSAILGNVERSWQDVAEVLGRFGPGFGAAREAYRRFVEDDDVDIEETLLAGGGFVPGPDGYEHRHSLRRGRERSTTSERILGTPSFIERCRTEVNAGVVERAHPDLPEIVTAVCMDVGIGIDNVRFGGRNRRLSLCRSGIAWLWCVRYGQSARKLGVYLGMAESSIREAVTRGASDAVRWLEAIRRLRANRME